MAAVATNGNGAAAVDVKEEMKRKLELEESEDESTIKTRVKEAKTELSCKCPYLDTIDRAVLDFDFEKLCSVSLSRINVYACLVCGKYFQVNGLLFLLVADFFSPGPRAEHSRLHAFCGGESQGIPEPRDQEILLSSRQLRGDRRLAGRHPLRAQPHLQ